RKDHVLLHPRRGVSQHADAEARRYESDPRVHRAVCRRRRERRVRGAASGRDERRHRVERARRSLHVEGRQEDQRRGDGCVRARARQDQGMARLLRHEGDAAAVNVADRIRCAWEGRITGCQLGKPVEILSMREGHDALTTYLRSVDSLPLRDYVGYREQARVQRECCRGHLVRSEPDDDINYSVLALLMLERHGNALTTVDVARSWLNLLPAGATFTAERAAYRILLARAQDRFTFGGDPGFDLSACSDNPYNDWIRAQIRADVYGWVCPGNPTLAAELARRDATLSHRGDGVYGAMFVAALGAALATSSPTDALGRALALIPDDSGAAEAVRLGASLARNADGDAAIRARYQGMSPVHTLNNPAPRGGGVYSALERF